MVSFRPHTMRVVHSGEGSYDTNGDWQEDDRKRCCCEFPCRYEPNGRANTITLPDGENYKYSYTVYLDVNPSFRIRYGDLIELTSQDGIVIGQFEVKGFHRGQLDMKIWV